MIGLMMLVGIVVTNAIVLLELVQQLRERGDLGPTMPWSMVVERGCGRYG